jgi:hypothetical protein
VDVGIQYHQSRGHQQLDRALRRCLYFGQHQATTRGEAPDLQRVRRKIARTHLDTQQMTNLLPEVSVGENDRMKRESESGMSLMC